MKIEVEARASALAYLEAGALALAYLEAGASLP